MSHSLCKQAKCLLAYRLEKDWARPILNIRSELGLVLEDEQLDEEVEYAIAKVQIQGKAAA